jgi:hypothetical protein
MLEHELDNALVAQKDSIIDLIDNGAHEEAVVVLKFVKPLWAAASYSYKYNELRNRGIQATTNYDENCHWKRVQSLLSMQNKYRLL